MSGEDVVERLRNFAIASRPELSAIADEVEALLARTVTTHMVVDALDAVLESTEWNGWTGRNPLSSRLRQEVPRYLIAAVDATPDPVMAALDEVERRLRDLTVADLGGKVSDGSIRAIGVARQVVSEVRAEHTTEGM